MGLGRHLESGLRDDFDHRAFREESASYKKSRGSVGFVPSYTTLQSQPPGPRLPGIVLPQQIDNHEVESYASAMQYRSLAASTEKDESRPAKYTEKVNIPSNDVKYGQLVTVHLDRRMWEFSNHLDLLKYFWGHSPDSNCMACGEPFTDQKGPPIRTFALEQLGDLGAVPRTTTTPFAIRIFNRHISCIRKFAVAFIPVSHVWDKSVAKAHGKRLALQEAASCLHIVLARMLPVVTAKFNHLYTPVELWHDYISIPQWNPIPQQRLLLALPDIFGVAPLCIVHLDDVLASCFKTAANGPSISGQVQRFQELSTFFRAQWFQRMWVALEYAHCNQACIYTMDDEIVYGDGKLMQDSFSSYLEAFQHELRAVIPKLGGEIYLNLFKQLPIPIVGLFANMRRNLKNPQPSLCFGEALEFVASRECRDYGDRFIAMCGFLRLGDYIECPAFFSKNPAHACLWVARRCLELGDHSPLLAAGNRNAPQILGAGWLIGHNDMRFGMWELGAAVSQPERQITIQENRISLDLDCIGTLETLYHFPNPEDTTTFKQVVSILLSNPQYHTAGPFVEALERIYAVPPSLRFATLPVKLGDYIRLQPDFVGRLEMLLSEYLIASSTEKSDRSLGIILSLIDMLHLSQQFSGGLNSFSRLSHFQLQNPSFECYVNILAFIHCSGCNGQFPYRFSLLRGEVPEAKLYRIPGLSYQFSNPNGVGLVISRNKIVGRMVFGSPACGCRTREVVKVM
jgi:hypothetical protein